MGIISIKNIIVPKMKVMSSASAFGMFHDILAKSLEDWINLLLQVQFVSAEGTVTSPGGVVTPFVATGLKPDIMKFRLNQFKIKNCAIKSGGHLFFKDLFDYIGSELSKQLKNWSTNPLSDKKKVPNPINVFGMAAKPMDTKHFKYYGVNCKLEMAVKKPDGENIVNDVWDTVEKYLTLAINKTPPMEISTVTGSVPGGFFSGSAQVKLVI